METRGDKPLWKACGGAHCQEVRRTVLLIPNINPLQPLGNLCFHKHNWVISQSEWFKYRAMEGTNKRGIRGENNCQSFNFTSFLLQNASTCFMLGSNVSVNKDVHRDISLEQTKKKFSFVLVVYFPMRTFIPHKQIPVTLPHCSPYLSQSWPQSWLQPLWSMWL